MEESADLFMYSDTLAGDQIRVMDIHPASGGQPIHCDLVTIWRSSKTTYKALSYVWGENTRTRRIVINQKQFWVPKNLFEALWHVRDEKRTVRLWTDAICIKQDDIAERDAQVQQMGKTYSQAEEVLIWLGTCVSDNDTLQVICDVAKQAGAILTHDEFARRFYNVYYVFLRPWFQRLWIFQEAVLAKRGTFMLGNSRCDLDEFLAIRFIPPLLTFNLNRVDSEAYRPGGLSLGLMNAITIGSYRRLLSDGNYRRFDVLRSAIPGDLVHSCRKRRCLDPRDHIFGLVGVAEQLGVDCEVVDYRMTTVEVFTTAFTNMLMRDAKALLQYEASYTGSLSTKLPTWVPDFSQEPDALGLDSYVYRAGRLGTDQDLIEKPFSVDGLLLKFRAFAYDDVMDLGRASHHGGLSWSVQELEDIEQRFVSSSSDSSPYGDFAGRSEAFWRTIVANRYRQQGFPHNDTGADYELFLTRATPIEGLQDDSLFDGKASPWKSELRNSTGAAYDNRNLFITKTRAFGLGPRRTELGDRIVIVLGVDTPLVVRKREPGSRYLMIGPAYVHGIMEGELVGQLKETDMLDSAEMFEIE